MGALMFNLFRRKPSEETASEYAPKGQDRES